MIIEHRSMKSRWAWTKAGLFLCAALSACTTPNPQSCADGNCTDPAFPYCDADGSLAGTPEVCIAVTCTPGDVAQCQGSEALTCNALGGDYDLVHCDHGCDLATGGCRLCEPNQTACTNGKVATCDAAGRPTVSETCALGCFESEPRCRELVPSNGLASLLDMPRAPDVSLIDATIDTGSGTVTTTNGPVLVPNTLLDSGRLRVFVVNDLLLRNVTITSTNDPFGLTGPAVAFVARGKIAVEGRVSVLGGAGGEKSATCRGGEGVFREDRINPTMTYTQSIGSGGGGNATPGARGGNYGTSSYRGGAAGGIAGTETLVPLRGGCASGGAMLASGGSYEGGSAGGGAIQLTSRQRIDIKGVVDARGAAGPAPYGELLDLFLGGGAGGGILLEAPQVVLGPGSALNAKGGAGAALGAQVPRTDTSAPDMGWTCTPPAGFLCGPGGNGAAVGSPATSGGDTATNDFAATGGGGGGLGRIRINVPNGSYTKASDAVEAGAVTQGLLVTR